MRGDNTAQKRLSEAEGDMEIRRLEQKSSEIAFYETRELESRPDTIRRWAEGSTGIALKRHPGESNAAVAQFDCSSAFNHADRTMILSHIAACLHTSRAPSSPSFRAPTLNLVRKEDGSASMSRRTTVSHRAAQRHQPRSPFSSCWSRYWPEVEARAGAEAKEAINLFASLNDLTMVTEERFLEDAIRTMEAALARRLGWS